VHHHADAAPEPPLVSPSPDGRSAWVAGVLGVAVTFAGMAYPVTGAALHLTSASVIATTRALAGGVVMLPVLALVGSRLPRSWSGWAWACAIGCGNVVLTLAGISEGTSLAGAAVASVLLNSAPFFAALLARVCLNERLTSLQIAGLVIGFAGILLIVAADHGPSGSHVAEGIVVCLSGSLGWAAAGAGMRYLSTREEGFDVYGATAAQFLCGGVLLLPYLLLSRPTPTDWGSARLWACLVFLVLGAQIVTYVGFYLALSHWASARVFAWTFLAPAVAVAIEAAEGNLPGATATVGMATVIGGVALVTSQ
jgi:drug/metabolite transporter (DMT)-like permease